MSKKDIHRGFFYGYYFKEINVLALGKLLKLGNDSDRWTSVELATYS